MDQPNYPGPVLDAPSLSALPMAKMHGIEPKKQTGSESSVAGSESSVVEKVVAGWDFQCSSSLTTCQQLSFHDDEYMTI
jgi:hypothetical protein